MEALTRYANALLLGNSMFMVRAQCQSRSRTGCLEALQQGLAGLRDWVVGLRSLVVEVDYVSETVM